MPVWLIPLVVQIASNIIDSCFHQTQKQTIDVQDKIYGKVLKKNRKAYGKMRGTQHV